ncbi:MAG: ABC transporter permease [Acholeplasmataceae bacterium]|nr:ABC transporter permease [Acholeplasmataceae bacterium]
MNSVGKSGKKSRFQIVWRRLRKNKMAMVGLYVIIIMLAVSALAPYLAPYDYDKQNYSAVLQFPNSEHKLGTDEFGRDILSRLLYGARYSFEFGIVAVAVGAAIGLFLGSLAGFFGGRTDNIIMRFLDIYQSVPMMVMAIALTASLGAGMRSAVIAIGISTMPIYARLIRGSLLEIRGMEYIEAAVAINASKLRILIKHMIPNAISPVIVTLTMSVGLNILAGASLSFVGLGAQQPLPEWGAMLSAGRGYMRDYPQLVIFPGILIMVLVLAFNMFGDGLRDALDPRQN